MCDSPAGLQIGTMIGRQSMQYLLLTYVVFCSHGSIAYAEKSHESTREKRQFPLKLDCDVSSTTSSRRCYKGDLVAEAIADCKKTSLLFTCNPVGQPDIFSTHVDVPDVSKHGVDCVPVRQGKTVVCGTQDTRCVCDAPVDITSALQRPYNFNHCRCQYWPAVDTRESNAAVCNQYDHGGTSGVHFYACCNNCNDQDTSCNGDTYQGGGSTNSYCGNCGERTASERRSRHTYTFNCGSCSSQRQCRDFCDEKHPLAAITPGLCPKWAGCFRGCCLNLNPTYRGKRSASDGFCGDNVCSSQSPGENSNNCPIDCCPIVNPTRCPASNCTETCCLQSRCCLPTSDHGSASQPHVVHIIILLVILMMVTMVI